jgi:hypothetical protein
MNTPSEPLVPVEHLSDATFYYPCSGRDWADPLRIFGPWVRHVRFVEINQRFRLIKNRGQLPDQDFPDWKFLSREIEGDPAQPSPNYLGPNFERDWPDYKPCVVSEIYRYLPTGREVTIHFHRSDGRKTLDRLNDPIGVFFHRGDTGPCDDPSEGSSGSHWLSKEWLQPVLNRMIDGGFVVTDGSCGIEYPELSRRGDIKSQEEAIASGKHFISDGIHFKCVGFAGKRNGPTLIWQIIKH